MSVAIITNDQGNVLVDTEFVRNAGFDVKDVLGGCFCSNLNEFIKNARSLVQMERPDIIIAEPIGTSTNILNSVVVPLRTLHPDEFELAPLLVVALMLMTPLWLVQALLLLAGKLGEHRAACPRTREVMR